MESYERPASWDAVHSALERPGATLIAGGTDVIPKAQEGLVQLTHVIDVRGVEGACAMTWQPDFAVSIGSAVTLRQIAQDPAVQLYFPLLGESAKSVGSYALRNMGTLGGNLAQDVRCSYFRHHHPCLRRGDATCSARSGPHEYHALFEQGPCLAVHPSDPAIALMALGATLALRTLGGTREIPVEELFVSSRERVDQPHSLGTRDVIHSVQLEAAASGGVWYFEKVTQRAAWDFALVSIAAHRRRDGSVRMVLGGVANTPWRIAHSVEEDVASGGLTADDLDALAERALYDASPSPGTIYKLTIARALLRRAMAALA